MHQACYFQHNQAIYRRIQSLGLSTAYSEDEEIRGYCRKIMALALLPLHEVEVAFYQLRATATSRIKQELRQLFLYFDEYWMNKVPMKMLNAHGHEHRTNNSCDGRHADTMRFSVNFRIRTCGLSSSVLLVKKADFNTGIYK